MSTLMISFSYFMLHLDFMANKNHQQLAKDHRFSRQLQLGTVIWGKTDQFAKLIPKTLTLIKCEQLLKYRIKVRHYFWLSFKTIP